MTLFDRKSASFGLRVVIPAALVLAATIGIVVFALNRMAGDVDKIENTITQKAVEAAVDSMLERLAQAHGDYAVLSSTFSDYAALLSPQSIARAFAESTTSSEFYDTAYLLDPKGNDLFAYRNGRALETPAAVEFGPALKALIARLAEGRGSPYVQTGLIETRNGLAAVAVGPTRRNLPRDSQRILILAKGFGNAAADELGRRFVISGLRLSFSKTQAGGVVLSDPLGRIIGTLFWDRPVSGRAALKSVSPVVMIMLLFLGVMVTALIAFAWRSIMRIEAGERETHNAIRQDSLTGLPNRFASRERLQEMLAEARADRRSLSAALLDLDGFKQVNDTYGHAIGDRLLCYIAERLRLFGGATVFLFRAGGDEFALWSFDDGTLLRRIGEQLIALLSKPINLEGRVVMVGASIGIATCPDEQISREELLRRTELAMYRAKEEGGNRVAVYHGAMDTALHERIAIAADLRDAIAAGELDVMYQPVFDATTRAIVSAEALVRWHRKGHGNVPPDVFVPIAEQSGLVGALGTAVLRRACRDARRWPFIPVSVNVSPAQLHDPMFEHLLTDILHETGIEPQRLILEITETYLVADPVRAKRAIDAVRGMGICVALDDFGTGFSSIGYLRQFAFDYLKLDRSVVADIARNEPARKLIQATVALADALSLSVTAEGVETEEDALMLRLAGCRYLQGFLLSRPISADQLTALMDGGGGRERQALIA